MSQTRVAIIMGSRSDWPYAKAAEALDALGVEYEAQVISAHRTLIAFTHLQKPPKRMVIRLSLPVPARRIYQAWLLLKRLYR